MVMVMCYILSMFVDMEKGIWDDEELGPIVLAVKSAARHYVFRIKEGRIVATVPPYADFTRFSAVLEQNRGRLRLMMQKAAANRPLFGEGDVVVTRDFTAVFQYVATTKFIFQLKGHCLYIGCPSSLDMKTQAVQTAMTKGLKRFVKRSAEAYLPVRLKELAAPLGLTCREVSVSSGRHRLGRCDSRGNVALSYYLMFLPDRLIDYVIWHELAHLTEMNHSSSFHDLCNRYCGGKEKELRKELRMFRFPVD